MSSPSEESTNTNTNTNTNSPSANRSAESGEKKGYQKPPIPRSESFLGKALKKYTKHDTRKLYEKHTAPFQCEAVIGPVGKNRTCWLCGFPIEHLAALKDAAGNYVFEFDAQKDSGEQEKLMDRGVCEHVLPVKLGFGILELFVITKDPLFEKLLHTEYEYAHNYCNFVKSNEYFVTLPLGSTNFCDLDIKHEIIDEILRQIFYNKQGSAHSSRSTVVRTNYKGTLLEFPNIVQAYCFTNDTKQFLADRDAYFRDVWAPRAKMIIEKKINRVISYVKEIDNCTKENETKGSHFSLFKPRLKKGNTTTLPRGTVGPSKLESLDPKYLERILKFRRAPSLNNILSGMSEEERVLPFRSPSFSGYEVNLSNSSRPSTPPKGKTRKARAVKNNSEEETESPANTTSSENASNYRSNVDYASLQRLLNSMLKKKEPNNLLTSMGLAAPTPTKPRLRRQTGTRKLVNTNSNYAESSNNNSNSNNSSAKYYPMFRKTSKTKPKAPAPAVPVLKNNLKMNVREDGVYITGKKTFNNRVLLKELGGVWNPAEKSWVLPKTVNLTRLLK